MQCKPTVSMQRLAPFVLSLVFTACAAPDHARIAGAVTTPLNDLNLFQDRIPEVLVDAQKQLYAAPADQSCGALLISVQALDAVLGPDFDAPESKADVSLVERGTAAMGDAAVGAIRGAAEGVIPFRRWVRKLSGAERHSKEGAAAIAAGTVRRAFLKGVFVARGCVAPVVQPLKN